MDVILSLANNLHIHVKVGSQYAAQLRDAAKRVMPRV